MIKRRIRRSYKNNHIEKSFIQERRLRSNIDIEENISRDQNEKKINKFGFIMLRHVKDENSDKHWKISYKCIKNYFPECPIVIIDDNSKQEYIDKEFQNNLIGTLVLNSEYPKRGELLPYYYYSRNKFFDVAIIIHDSVFINKRFEVKVDQYKFLWHFNSDCAHIYDDENALIKKLENHDKIESLHKNLDLWKGCFGCMSIINHDFLTKVNKRHNLSNLLPFVNSRPDRMLFERVLACIFQTYYKYESQNGSIHDITWGTTLQEAVENEDDFSDRDFIKVWLGR